jgi:cobalt-zinc-cadmium resistance protein CzcA
MIPETFSVSNRWSAIPLTFGATKARMQALEYDKQVAETNAKMQKNSLQHSWKMLSVNISRIYSSMITIPIRHCPMLKKLKAAQLGYKTGEISYVEYLLPYKRQPIFS